MFGITLFRLTIRSFKRYGNERFLLVAGRGVVESYSSVKARRRELLAIRVENKRENSATMTLACRDAIAGFRVVDGNL